MKLSELIINDLPEIEVDPFEHFASKDILNYKILNNIIESFPSINDIGWFGDPKIQLMLSNPKFWPVVGKEVFNILMSDEFCLLLSNKFNTPILHATTIGGGYQCSGPSAMLDYHIDAQKINGLYRWLNLHIYLNKDWKSINQGELIFIDKKTKSRKVIPPDFGMMTVYKSGCNSLHGHPGAWISKKPRMLLSVFYLSEIPTPDYDESKNIMGEIDEEAIDILMNPTRSLDEVQDYRNLKYK